MNCETCLNSRQEFGLADKIIISLGEVIFCLSQIVNEIFRTFAMSLADQIQSYLSIIMNAVSHLVKESIPSYLHSLPVPDSLLGWFSLSISDWARLVPFGVAVGGLSYLSLQVVIIKIAILLYLSTLIDNARALPTPPVLVRPSRRS